MSQAQELKITYQKQQRNQKFIHTLFIICICLIIVAAIAIAVAYIEANEYVKVLVATDTKTEYDDGTIAKIIANRVSLANTISFTVLVLSAVGVIVFKYLSEKTKKQYLSSEVLLKDSTENKENLYD